MKNEHENVIDTNVAAAASGATTTQAVETEVSAAEIIAAAPATTEAAAIVSISFHLCLSFSSFISHFSFFI